MEQSVVTQFASYLECSMLAESSREIKKRALKWFVRTCGDRDVKDVTVRQAEGFRNGIFNTLVHRGRDPDRAKVTANIYLANFKPFFSWLVENRTLRVNVFRRVRAFVLDEKRRRPFTPAEIARLLMVADKRWKAMILLGLMSMRRGEIQNLVIGDILWDKNMILISPKKDTACTWRWSIKNHQQAYVPLCPEIETAEGTIDLHRLLLEIIQEWVPEKQPYVFLEPKRYQKLMDLKQHGKLTYAHRCDPWGNFSRSFRGIQKRAMVEPRRFQDLRGTFATRLGERLPLRKIQKLMRHASPQTTVKYIHIEEQELVAESAAILKQCYA